MRLGMCNFVDNRFVQCHIVGMHYWSKKLFDH